MNNLFILIISLFIYSSNENPVPQQQVIKGKVVYKSCASMVVQITDSAYYHLGQTKWQRTPADKEYEHVFLVRNMCSVAGNQIQRDQEFQFTIINESNQTNACARCMFYDYPPNIVLSINAIKKAD